MKKSMAMSLALAALMLVGCGGAPGDNSQIIADELAKHAQQQGLVQGGGAETNQQLICSAVCTCTPSGCNCSEIVCVPG
jgi:hypothetical protein